ncbi:MAG TPA: glycosyltransferase family 4 protein [Candidatus Baltobacteraceae bacterium]|nr:glycosyltransferase family 4 protein [Candidatus Baltobacteraceae bacterium]
MRILVMVNNFPWPQSIDGTFNLLHLRALRELGHEICVLRWAPWAPPLRKQWKRYRSIPDAYEYDGFRVRTLRVLIGPANLAIGSIRRQRQGAIAREIAAFTPDVVQVHGLIPAGVMALDSPVPYVLTGHGTETYKTPFLRDSLRALSHEIVTRAAFCVGVSDFVAGKLRMLGARDPRVIFNGADEDIFFPRDRVAARLELGLHPNRPTVMYAGHMLAQKGMAELQAAALALREMQPQFIFAGGNAMQPEIERTLRAAKIDALFPGVVGHEKLATLYAAADVVTLPSYAEGLPLLVCEAMCSGRAVVATNVGGIPEIVRDGETGYLIPPRDADALTDRLRRVLAGQPIRERFERAAYTFAREHLTWRVNARAYDEIYRDIVAGRYGNDGSSSALPALSTSA